MIRSELQSKLVAKQQLIFRPLIIQEPHIKEHQMFDKRKRVLRQFDSLKPDQQDLLTQMMNPFVYDPGVAPDFEISQRDYDQIKTINPQFNEKKKPGVKILNKKMLLTEAEEAILSGNKVALLKFDINFLRLIDKTGHADHILRSLSTILNGMVVDDPKLKITAARTGGDSFCLLVSSQETIDQKLLGILYEKVRDQFGNEQTYYMVDQDQKDIRQANSRLKKEEKGQILIANHEEQANKMLKVLMRGRIPDLEDLLKVNIKNEEISKIKTNIRKKHLIMTTFKEISKTIDSIKKLHPDLNSQISSIEEILKDKNNHDLAEYALSFIEGYYNDPLFDEQVFQAPDFYKLLHNRSKDGNERVIYSYMPWLKNMNSTQGESATDENIIEIYIKMKERLEKELKKRNTLRARKDGADLIFLSQDYIDEVLFVKLSNISKTPFKDNKIPIFITSTKYPDGSTNVQQDIENMKYMGQVKFISWLNGEIVRDENQGKEILRYYLQDRTEDRCRELLSVIKTMKKTYISAQVMMKTHNFTGLTFLLEKELKNIKEPMKVKILKELGIKEINHTPILKERLQKPAPARA